MSPARRSDGSESSQVAPRLGARIAGANIGIVLTGALVRLTDSGLGCPRWPKCDAERWTTHPALGIHGAIEFGNRLLTYVLVAIAVGTLVSVWRWPGSTPAMRRLAVALAAGIPLQGVIGGLTVLTDLNPWLVSLHLVLSMVLIAGAAVLVDQVASRPRERASAPCPRHGRPDGSRHGRRRLPRDNRHRQRPARRRRRIAPQRAGLLRVQPHPRLRRLHAGGRDTSSASSSCAERLGRAAWALLAIEAAQAAIGLAQYNLGLPVALVAAHLLGAALLVAAAATMTVRARAPLVSR